MMLAKMGAIGWSRCVPPAIALLLIAAPAAAHMVDKGLATISVSERSVDYNLLLTLSSATPQSPDVMQLSQTGAASDYASLLQAIQQRIRIASNGRACTAAPGSIAPP